MEAIVNPGPLPLQAPIKPINLGNITYTKADGTLVTRGIQVYLLDSQGNQMNCPEGWNIDSQLVAKCSKLAQELINEHLKAEPALKEHTLGGFNERGLQVITGPTAFTPPYYPHNVGQSAQKWSDFRQTILDYFHPQQVAQEGPYEAYNDDDSISLDSEAVDRDAFEFHYHHYFTDFDT
jgi:hypothetical protein